MSISDRWGSPQIHRLASTVIACTAIVFSLVGLGIHPVQAACRSEADINGVAGGGTLDLQGCTVIVGGGIPYDGPGQTILMPITGNVLIYNGTIAGPSDATKGRLFSVRPGGTLSLVNVTLSDGFAQGGNGGAGGSSNGSGGGGGGGIGGSGGPGTVYGGGGGGGGSLNNGGSGSTNGGGGNGGSAWGGGGGDGDGTGGFGGDGSSGTDGSGSGGGSGTTFGNINTPGTGGGGGGFGGFGDGHGGSGGFGGGGGGNGGDDADFSGAAGPGGGSGGNGVTNAGGGGGGAGIGGAVLIDVGGTLNTSHVTFSGNKAYGGNGGDSGGGSGDEGGGAGGGYGSAVFNAGNFCNLNAADTFSGNTPKDGKPGVGSGAAGSATGGDNSPGYYNDSFFHGGTNNCSGFNPAAPSITTNPTSQQVCVGSPVSFSAAASGSPAPTVQWQENNGNISGATNTTYSFTANIGQNGHTFHALFTNIYGSATTTNATLTVNSRPMVTINPANQTVMLGQMATFTAAASNSTGVQWKVSTDSGTSYTNINGATSNIYSFTPTAADGGHKFEAVFSGACGSATTTAATLTVKVTITLSPAKPNTMKVGVPFSQTVVAAGGTAPYTYSLDGTLPPGLNFAAGVISGTPTAIGAFSFKITATDTTSPGGPYSASQTYSVKIDPPTVLLSTNSPLLDGKVGTAYSATFTASGGTAPYTYTETGALPAGLTFSGGSLSGTPTAAGTFSFSITTTDSTTGAGAPVSASKVYKLTIAP